MDSGCEEKFANRFDHAKQIGNVSDEIIFTRDGDIISKLGIEESRKIWTDPLWTRLA